jgi:hypothetical protein
MPDDRYQVTDRARDAARRIIQAGDQQLSPFESFTDIDLDRLAVLIKQIVMANETAPEPPEKWAILKRFRVGDKNSPRIVQIREYLMDLFAYRDDAHISASHPHFGQAGIIWNVLSSLSKNDTVTADQLAESLSFRGYEVSNYEVALEAAAQIGWAEPGGIPGVFCISQQGHGLHERVEQLTNEFFYAPWSVLTPAELDELYALLMKLREQLNSFRKAK